MEAAMTNEEKIKAWCEYDSNNMDMYELIVADEREKMQTEIGHLEYKIEGLQQALSRNKDEREKIQGVEVYISWDDNDFTHNIKVACDMEPKKNVKENGSVYYTLHDVNCYFPKNLAEYIGLKKGQCKKVRIVEATP